MKLKHILYAALVLGSVATVNAHTQSHRTTQQPMSYFATAKNKARTMLKQAYTYGMEKPFCWVWEKCVVKPIVYLYWLPFATLLDDSTSETTR